MIYVPIHKKLEQIFEKNLKSNVKFGLRLWNSLNCISAVTFDRRFFILGKLMPLDGFIKQWHYLGRQSCLTVG